MDETLDAIGGLQIFQRRKGYRFSVDALLLADFARVDRGPIVDLGTGSGIVALALARQTGCPVTAVELQPDLAALARRNAALNGLGEQVEVIEGDLRGLRSRLAPGTFECAVSNPPFFEAGAGHVNPASEKALARHEVAGSIRDVACAARWLLGPGGRLCVVFPAPRLTALTDALDSNKLALARLRCVHSRPDRDAHLVLAEAIKNAPRTRTTLLAPLFLFDDAGRESDEAKAITARVGAPRSKGQGLPQRR
ncbi:MAG: methyltransferase [Myxococcales bacterium]|jgi:tRNA1Val (adenine37-N6)-methyltransferase|nr:methyltransferase [Myxococcales bacterium]